MEVLFSIKKAIAFFIEPLGLILSLSLLGLFFLYKSNYSKAKVLLSFSLVLLFVFSYPPIANTLVKQLESQYTKYSESDDIHYIHVLGSGHHEDDNQPISSQISSSGLKRTLEGARIFKQLNNPKLSLVFTGYAGPGNQTPNAIINAEIAKIIGIDTQNIIISGHPRDTKEEAVFIQDITNNKPFILVTSASHMPRAMMIFNSLGMNPIAAPTDFHGSNKSWLTLPNISDFKKTDRKSVV